MTKQHLNITLHALRILRAVALVAFYSAVCSCDTKMAENDQMWIFRPSRGWRSRQPPQRCFLLAAGGVTCGAFPPVVLERRYPKEVQDLYETMRRFARILGPVEHDKFIESHARESGRALQPTGTGCIICSLNISLSWRAGGGFSPPPPSNYLRKTNTFVVWYTEWAASGFFPLNCVWALCLSSQLTEHSDHVLEVVFFYLKTTVYLLGLCIRGRIKSLYYVCVERLGAGSKLNSLKDTR